MTKKKKYEDLFSKCVKKIEKRISFYFLVKIIE